MTAKTKDPMPVSTMTELQIDTSSIDSYRQFLAVRRCPSYRFRGSVAVVPDEYAAQIIGKKHRRATAKYSPSPFLFDYQRDITRLAITKKRFAAFVE